LAGGCFDRPAVLAEAILAYLNVVIPVAALAGRPAGEGVCDLNLARCRSAAKEDQSCAKDSQG